ncbi:hypothetical protein [Streptomyces curacoi]|uniref:DUF3558 domain-containing protein n=1 Tax=Streptomyces curacoi TaxID=146536 RepID=A0A117NWQ8_9ACTN|nr:hypothetical protein [Streptomyces curacoi]KUM68779.1 hypothetical protein AQI70_32735 [Streptomyces curacoi]
MMVRRFSRAAAGSITVIAFGLLTACGTSTQSTPSVADRTSPPVTGAGTGTGSGAAGSVKTLPPSELCTILTVDVAKQLIADARPTARVSPDKGEAPDVCGYTAADGGATLSLSPASRTYDTELAAAHDLRANPAPAGMRDVRVEPVSDLGRRGFRETSRQVQARQHITFVVWDAGARTWVMTFATSADTSTKPTPVSDDKVVRVARSVTAKLPPGQ